MIMKNLSLSTHASLFVQLVSEDEKESKQAWQKFLDKYSDRIYTWCKRWCKQEAEAEDVMQDVLLCLFQRMGSFQYDPDKSFRAWLRQVVFHVFIDFHNKQQRAGKGSGSEAVFDRLHLLPAQDDLVQQLDKAFDLELWEDVKQQVKTEVGEQTWQAFEMTENENVTKKEAAEKLGITISALYRARFRVKSKLKETYSAWKQAGRGE